jgi:hypothetical protein
MVAISGDVIKVRHSAAAPLLASDCTPFFLLHPDQAGLAAVWVANRLQCAKHAALAGGGEGELLEKEVA